MRIFVDAVDRQLLSVFEMTKYTSEWCPAVIVPGYFSWRNSGNGSWFIQALVQVFRQHAYTMDVLHMLTLVNKVVAYDFESFTDKEFNSGMKQVPCIVSTLTKLFYFEEKAKCCYS